MAKRQRKSKLGNCDRCGRGLRDGGVCGEYCPSKKCNMEFLRETPRMYAPIETHAFFTFYNDTKKPVEIRTTEKSSQLNMIKFNVQPQTSVQLEVRPGGFIKLWEYENSFQLLVE